MTIKRAKELAKQQNGRLPRPGYEVSVATGLEDGARTETYLQNNAGRFRIWTWEEPLPRSEYERRDRTIRSTNLAGGT